MADERQRRDGQTAVPIGPIVAWLAVQLAALALSAGRVPLSARFPRVGEELAVHVLLVAQVTTASLLFPLLLRDARTLVIAILTALPFLQLTGYLAGTPAPRLAGAAAYLVVWLVGLALWRAALPTGVAALHAVAVASALALGGPLLWYARAEFARHSGEVNWSVDGMLGPIMGALAQLEQSSFAAGPWVTAGVFALAGGAAALALRARTVHGRATPSG